MPRSPTVLTPPPGTLPFVPNTTIESGKANAVWLDLYQDGNTPRPIEYGGTGASNAADALNNLGAVGQGNFLDAYPVGDFYGSVRTLDSNWLRRNGALYNRTDYPELGDLLPALPDGLEFTQVHSNGGNIRAFVTGLGKIVAPSADGKVSISEDNGRSWYTVSSGVPVLGAGPVSGSGTNSCFGLGYFFSATLTNQVAMSSDGDTWFLQTALGSDRRITAVAFDGQYVYAAGTDGSNENGQVFRTNNGADWTNVTPAAMVSGIVRWIVSDGTNLLLRMSSNNLYVSSDRGATWDLKAGLSPAPSDYAAIWTGSKYLTSGSSGAVSDSTNANLWTSRTSGTANALFALARSSTATLSGGASGTIRLSTNEGVNWSGAVLGTSSAVRAITVNPTDPNYFLIGTESGLIYEALKTSPTQFRVPDDDPQYGWIKAKND